MLLYPLSKSTRTFQEYVSDLSSYINDYYPELVPFFSDNTVGQILFESQAGIAASLSFQLERAMQETRVDYANIRRNLFTLAKNNGIKIPNVSASATYVDFTFDVPAEGDSFSKQYLPIIKSGTQVIGAGQVFEVIDDIDFSSSVNSQGIQNRKFLPILDSSNRVVRYEITKREILFSGQSKIFRKQILESSDFLEIVLPDANTIAVEQVAIVPNSDAPQNPDFSLFSNPDYKWDIVPYLSQKRVFRKYGQPDSNGLYSGKWFDTDKRCIYEFTPNGLCKVTFGNGRSTKADFKTILKAEDRLNASLRSMLNTNALGLRVPSNHTVYIRYRVGGGSDSNISANTITGLGFSNIISNGASQNIANEVIRTLRVSNPVPAIGGKEAPTNEEIRNLIDYGKPSKDGATLLKDYKYIINSMQGVYGRPEKASARVIDNKVSISIIGIDGNGKYTDSGNQLLKDNLYEYLSDFKMINDFIEIIDAKIVNIAFELDILIDGSASDFVLREQIIQTVNAIVLGFSGDIGDDVFLGTIYRELNGLEGVINVNGIKAYNMVDTSDSKYSQHRSLGMASTLVSENGTIQKYSLSIPDNILVSMEDEIFEVKDLQQDIKIVFKKRVY